MATTTPQPDSWGGSVTARYAQEAAPTRTTPHIRQSLSLVQLAPTARVLDVAAGSGAATFAVLPYVSHVTATDYSHDMVVFMRRKAHELGVESQVDVQQADGQDLHAFTDASFDVVLCTFGLLFMPDKRRAVQEMSRVLRPGGVLVVTTWANMQRSQYFTVLSAACKHGLAATAQPPASTGFDKMAASQSTMETEAALADLLKVGAFSSVSVTSDTLPGRVFHSPADLWYSMKGTIAETVFRLSAADHTALDTAAINYIGSIMGARAAFTVSACALTAVAKKRE